ncbi:MAG: hypothetical protein AB7V48_10370 [Sedimentibacter sp.]
MSVLKNLTKLMITLLLTVTVAGVVSGCASNATAVEGTNRLDTIKERGYLEVVMEPAFAPKQQIPLNVQ